MRLLPALALLAWANALANARGEHLEQHDTDSIDCHDADKNHELRGVGDLWDDDICPHSAVVWDDDRGLARRWRQWVRRADPTTNGAAAQPTEDDKDDSGESDDAKPSADAEDTKDETKPAETTQEEKPTEAEKTTEVKETKEPETTQKKETKEESTVEQPTVPSPTLPTQTLPTETQSEGSAMTSDGATETSNISSDQATFSSYSSEKIGASCFSTTIEHTTVCSTRTRDGHIETHGCVPANITSSACAPGMLCTTHPDSGNDVCMKLHNEVGTAGIVIAGLFGFLGAACTFTMVFICYSDKRAAAKFQKKRLPKSSESAGLLAKAPTPSTPPA